MINFRSRKNLIIGSILLFILVATLVIIFNKDRLPIIWKKEVTEVLWLEKINKKEFVWEYVSDKAVDTKNVFNSGSDDWNKEKQQQEELDKVKPYIRLLCWVFTKTYDILKSPSMQLIKTDIDKIAKNSKDKDYFSYITIPAVVYWECNWKDWTFLDGIVKYLQSDYNSIYLIDKENVEKYMSFIEDINFVDNDINNSKLKTDKEYFKKIFFEDNRFPIEKVYFNEYTFMQDKSDEEYFKYFSILSMEELNEIQERTLKIFTDFLKSKWIKDINEFRNMILTNYWYWKDVESLKKILINDYNELDWLLKEKWISLTQELLDNNSLYNFYTWDKYKELKNDEKLYSLLKKIWLWYLHYWIISPKYAETLNQWWSWKEQFWDSVVWNWIIKLWFIILRENSKK